LQAVNLQQDYLHAMGISRWLPREPLAHAPVSAEWVDGFVWPQPDLSRASVAAVADTAAPVATPSIAAPQHSADNAASRQQALAALQMDDVKTGTAPAPKAGVESSPLAEAAEVVETPLAERMKQPQFSLSFTPAGDLLVVDSLPPHAREAVGPEYQRLLAALCRAMGAEVQLDAMCLHHWPMFASSSLNQGGDEAQRAVRRQLDVMLKKYPARRVLLLGEPAAQWLLEQDHSLEDMRGLTFTLRAGVSAVTSYSLMHMLKLPEFKADCWRDLQPLL
jgi:hypothetical protein